MKTILIFFTFVMRLLIFQVNGVETNNIVLENKCDLDNESHLIIGSLNRPTLLMNGPVIITGDRVCILSDIITNGYKLSIYSNELYFIGNRKIIGFTSTAESINFIDFSLVHSSPDKCSVTGLDSPAFKGSVGVPGIPGNQNPDSINIYAISIYGVIEINGDGQTGGPGGKGGKGGKGARGCPGRDASVSIQCPGTFQVYFGTDGGRGGVGGQGGDGGVGGLGGRPVAIQIYAVFLENSSLNIHSEGGKGGVGGKTGDLGDPGEVGKGGGPKRGEKKCLFYTVVKRGRGGQNGSKAPSQVNLALKGAEGKSSDSIPVIFLSISEFRDKTKKILSVNEFLDEVKNLILTLKKLIKLELSEKNISEETRSHSYLLKVNIHDSISKLHSLRQKSNYKFQVPIDDLENNFYELYEQSFDLLQEILNLKSEACRDYISDIQNEIDKNNNTDFYQLLFKKTCSLDIKNKIKRKINGRFK